MSVTLHLNYGDIKIELFCYEVTRSCENFLALCASGQYDGTSFHRNIANFIIQGGDPTGTGKGGKSIWGGYFEDEIDPNLKFNRRGIVAYANAGSNMNGSQFFITYSKQSHLDKKNTIFGHVIDGFEVLDELEKQETDSNNKPINPITINSVTIHSNPIADKQL
ncbi:ring-type e3 ubiquitin-protein ligase ppil2 [Anaeramoeba flamelloides]|uniref:Peptidyl-prolyl cis-trans isomerase n=1 Tax=Anaeramoeba flamelloides TaxID=1746091 RepID=A0AAV7Y6F2_9EUKA|nr:ring-type e3 ubiquitin-protein ligase ppil2 [Anaeramoeba flamelloides]KAJ6236622.1 ring-type e3 ubiquitin-protein ligase ppil2 [Anaeramoeba flamelloides]|eukprot:Anaeramoba_flamelloidesa569283_36.p1 GENE.a569283_36~~a569283_36.p1  ORF type:complete len:181 (+),score=31.75 a569283_36:53-544(+)